jgi:hypothetical protein
LANRRINEPHNDTSSDESEEVSEENSEDDDDSVSPPESKESSSDDSDEPSNVLVTNKDSMKSRNNEIEWSKEPPRPVGRTRASNIMRQNPGPSQYILNNCVTPKDIFLQFFTQEMLSSVANHTNQEGRIRKADDWVQTNFEDILRFIGCIVLAGVFVSKNESVSQLWSRENGRSIFPKIMSRHRFSMLTSCLRFDDRATRQGRRENDKLAPFREFWTKFITRCKANYFPDVHVTVDEMLVTYRGRCPFKMYIPSKPGRYGLKIWVLADTATKYCYNAEVYVGKRDNVREVNQATRVVLELSEPLSGSGRNIIGDNFFSSIHLVRCLEQRKLTYLGTIRKNKPELPLAFQPSRHRAVESSMFGFHKEVTVVSYVPKKNKAVNLISSLHNAKEVSEDRGKPLMILDYNKLKCGVDTLDQVS